MRRIKWVRTDGGVDEFLSSNGRFIIRRVCLNPKYFGYWGLTDVSTGTEFPCRTEGSAKAAARNLTKGRES